MKRLDLSIRLRVTTSRSRRAAALSVFLLLLALPAAAQDEAVPLSEEEHGAWTAIGRVNVGGLNTRGTCTGTLVAPDLVLTAAHCVSPRALRDENPEKMHFVAGWFRDEYVAHRTAERIHVHPDYVRGERGIDTLHTDVALLELAEPVPDDAAKPMPIGAFPGFADGVEIIAYSKRRSGALARSGPCVSIVLADDLLGATCPVAGGNSGAPLLQEGPDGWAVVAVAVATNKGPGAFRSFAARPAEVLFELAGREMP